MWLEILHRVEGLLRERLLPVSSLGLQQDPERVRLDLHPLLEHDRLDRPQPAPLLEKLDGHRPKRGKNVAMSIPL